MSDKWRVTGGRKTAVTRETFSCHPSRVTRHFSAFTLIELLVVISIIAVLAAFTITVTGVVKRKQYISETQAEMGKLVSAIEGYKTTYNFYPPSNPGYPANASDAYYNPLYYELMGTTINGLNYVTLDNSAQIPIAQRCPDRFSGREWLCELHQGFRRRCDAGQKFSF